MERNLFGYERLLAELVEARGYTPRYGTEWDPLWRSSCDAYALIAPPTVVEWQGKRRGRMSNELVFTILINSYFTSDEARCRDRERVSGDAMAILSELSRHLGVVETSDLTVEVVEMPIPNYEGVAVKVSVTVTSNYGIGWGDVDLV